MTASRSAPTASRSAAEAPRCTLAPGIPDPWALGADDAHALLEGELWGSASAEDLPAGPGWETQRLPLPGTPLPGEDRLRGAPRGAGTGWLRLRRFAPWGTLEGLRWRLRAPGGATPAEREWNLLCHLRAAGVATVEPLAVVADGGSGRSALLTRDADPGPSLEQALGMGEGSVPGLSDALAHLVKQLTGAGAWLPHLEPARIRVQGLGEGQAHAAPEGSCALEQVLAARGDRPVDFGGTLRVRELPSLVLLEAPAGAVRRARAAARWEQWARALQG